jgi:hypothetical protein
MQGALLHAVLNASMPADPIDARVREFFQLMEIDDGARVADALFRRKYATPAPGYPHHIAAFHRESDGRLALASYLHFLPHGDIMLIGGACTDGDLLRRLPDAERAAVDAAGGLMLQTTRYALDRFWDRCEAVFGHCGDERSFTVLARAGFVRAKPPYLIVRWNRELDEVRQRELIEQAAAIGPF